MAIIHVAVAVIVNQKNQVLIARRASHQHQGNKWEFPGGKVENGESSQQALKREIKEELDVEIQSSEFMIEIDHQYQSAPDRPAKKVRLEVYQVTDWQGDVCGKEGQPILWVEKKDLAQYQFPDANAAIISLLQSAKNI